MYSFEEVHFIARTVIWALKMNEESTQILWVHYQYLIVIILIEDF